MRDRQIRYRYERDCAEKRAWKSGSAAAASTTAASSGSDVFSASAMRSTCGPPSTSTLATFANACTPVSVRPATASESQRGNTSPNASRKTASTVRSPGCAAQP